MKRTLSVFLIACSTVFINPTRGVSNVEGTIEKTVDGDTLWVTPDKVDSPEDRLKIRMIGMDAPETHLPSPNGVVGQGKWGDDATDFLAELAPKGTQIRLEDHGLDKYKRVLGRVFHKGTDLNLEMVANGLSVTYIICDGKECAPGFLKNENVAGYVEACESAQEEGLGIWDPKHLLKEMPFEFRLRMQNREPDKFVANFSTKELFAPEDYTEVPVCQRIFFMTEKKANALGFHRGKRIFPSIIPNLKF